MPRRDAEEWLVQVGREMSSLADELASGRPRVAGGRNWEPRIDLLEEKHRFIVRAEIAGVRGEDISLHYNPERHALLIRGVRMEPDAPNGERRAYQLEIMYGEFQREVAFPAVSIDAQGIRAQYRHGMLLIMVPKLERYITLKTTVVGS